MLRFRALLATTVLTTACVDDVPLYRVEPPSDGWPSILELDVADLQRFRLEVPPGTRGFLLYTEGPPDEASGISELIAPDGRAVIEDGIYRLGDRDRGTGWIGAAALAMPNHDIDVSEGGTWRVGVAPRTEHLEIWSAVEVDVPAKVVDVVTHAAMPYHSDGDLETLFEEAFNILGLTLGRLERRGTLELVRIDIDDADDDAALIPREDEPVLNVLFYWELDGGRGISSTPGLPRGGSRVGGVALEYDAGPRALAHEIGHFLGLFHTTDGGGNDLLESTPRCEPSVFEESPAQCPSWGNLMDRLASDDVLTGEQRFVIESSVLWHP